MEVHLSQAHSEYWEITSFRSPWIPITNGLPHWLPLPTYTASAGMFSSTCLLYILTSTYFLDSYFTSESTAQTFSAVHRSVKSDAFPDLTDQNSTETDLLVTAHMSHTSVGRLSVFQQRCLYSLLLSVSLFRTDGSLTRRLLTEPQHSSCISAYNFLVVYWDSMS